jgi:heat shock protein HtpX
MYIVDAFQRMMRKANIPILIYLVLNVFVIGGVISLLFGMQFWLALLIGVGLYAVSLAISLSPVGEWILRTQNGCKELKDPEQIRVLEPIFRQVYAKAKAQDPTIPDDVKLFINDDDCPNAFATGRKTICVTAGLLQLPENLISATLGHEFGHLAHHDTDLILIVSVGNFIINAFIMFIKVMLEIGYFLFGIIGAFVGGDEGWFMGIITAISRFLTMLLVNGLTWLWTKIGVLLVMKSSRSNEFEADAFSARMGYANDLCMLLDAIDGSDAKGLFANLVSSHPKKKDRIAKLRELGATYQLPGGNY